MEIDSPHFPAHVFPFKMQTVLQFVSKRAGFDLPPEAASKIIDDSGGNLRKAILVLEALKMQSSVVLDLFSFSHLLNFILLLATLAPISLVL